MSTDDTSQNKNLPKQSDPTRLDKDRVPDELSVTRQPVHMKYILSVLPGDKITFSYGDFIPNAISFNQYLEANVRPGDTMKLERNSCLTMIKRLTDTLNTGGLDALPMVCMGAACDKYQSCNIRLAGIPLQIGEPCPLERTDILNHVRKLSHDFGGERTYADQLLIQGVAGMEVLKSRAMAEMAKHPTVIIELSKGVDSQGNVIKEKAANPAFELLNKLSKNELSLLKALAMTAQERMKNDANRAKTADEQAAGYRKRLAKLKAARDSDAAQDEVDVEVTILEEEILDAEIKEVRSRTEPGTTQRVDGPSHQSSQGDECKGTTGDLGESTGSVGGEGQSNGPAKRRDGRESFEFNPGLSPFNQRGGDSTDSDSEGHDDNMEEVR